MARVDIDPAFRVAQAVSAFGPARNAAILVADLASDPESRALLCTFVSATDIPQVDRPLALGHAIALSEAGEDSLDAKVGKLRVLDESDSETVRFRAPITFDNGAKRAVHFGMRIERGHWRIAEFGESPIA